MKKHHILSFVFLIGIALASLSACAYEEIAFPLRSAINNNDEYVTYNTQADDDNADTIDADIIINVIEVNEVGTLTNINDEVDTNVVIDNNIDYAHPPAFSNWGWGRMCYTHSIFFCSPVVFDHFIGLDIIDIDDYSAWERPLRSLRTSPYEDCTVNIISFINHFGITRDVFQYVIDTLRLDYRFHYNLDILFSGDSALIEQYYSIANEELHMQIPRERHQNSYLRLLWEAQQIVNAYVIEQGVNSIYFHDIWTYGNRSRGIEVYTSWMMDLIERGEYGRVNIIEFVNHFGLSRAAFERFKIEDSMYLFGHYNLDVIFSGNAALIASYYSVANESLHRAQVEMAFEQHVATHGMPADNRMVD